MLILDTNILSEVIKPVPSKSVLHWLAEQEALSLFTTTITQAELLYGVEILPAGKRKSQLHTAVETMFASEFPGRILSFDESSARFYAQIVAKRETLGRRTSQADAMIAAIARAHRATLVTRNTRDFEHCGVRLLDPFLSS